MKFIRKTTIKQIITSESRNQLKEKFDLKIGQAKKELEQLQFEKKKLIYQKKFSQSKVEKRFVVEENKRQQLIEWYEYQLQQLHDIPDGNEIVEGEVDEVVEVDIGDNWDAISGNRSILIKDGKIIDIN
ncbi:YlqD family protein [Filobacillus milosensis]|nr:YlqD family protein [Filobacillus milosensis]